MEPSRVPGWVFAGSCVATPGEVMVTIPYPDFLYLYHMFRPSLLFPIALFSLMIFSCKKDDPIIVDPPPAEVFGKAAFQFDAFAQAKPLEFDTILYRNSSNEVFSVTKLNYYITNLRFRKTDGSFFSEAESYHLIQHVEKQNGFTVSGLPEGSYNGVEFLIGVDSLRNVSGSQTGALDVANSMFWEWDTGYIFYKLEGKYSDGNVEEADYSIHIGGFKGPYKCIQKVFLEFPGTLVITKDHTSQVKLKTTVEEIFDSPLKIGVAKYYEELSNGNGLQVFQQLSVNYRDMIKVETVVN
jgi:hypothetical protein